MCSSNCEMPKGDWDIVEMKGGDICLDVLCVVLVMLLFFLLGCAFTEITHGADALQVYYAGKN